MNYERFEVGSKKIFLVDMKQDRTASGFSSLADGGIRKMIKEGKKVLIIANKKGFATGMLCDDCGYIPKCDHCDIPIAFHQDAHGELYGICHICKKHYSSFGECPQCHGHNIKLYGNGVQKLEGLLQREYGATNVVTIDSETANSQAKVKKLMQILPEAQIVVGTSLLMTAPKDRKPDLVVVFNADSWLHIPDYKSHEKTFTTLLSIINNYADNIIVQSYHVDSPAIRLACEGNMEAFAVWEKKFRQEHAYPPFSEIAVILYKNEIEQKMFTTVNKLYQELLFLAEKADGKLEIYATPPLVYKMHDKYRYNIVIKWAWVRGFLDGAFEKLNMAGRGFKIDRMPENLV